MRFLPSSERFDHIAALVILDGCGSKALRRANTPFIDELARGGAFSYQCRSVCPSATYTAHSSLLTGKLPREHGIVGNSFFDRGLGRVVDLDKASVSDFLDTRTLFEVVSGLCVCVGCAVCRGADVVVSKEEVQARGVWEQNQFAVERALDALERFGPRVLVAALLGIDAVGERFGPDSEEYLRALEEADELVEKLDHALSRLYRDHLLVVVSDHGMVSVSENLDIEELLKPFSPVVCVSHRFAHVYLSEGVVEAGELLEEVGGVERVFSRGELGELGLDHLRSGDLVVVAGDGVEFGMRRLRGSHGGFCEEEVFVPLVVNRSEFRDLMGSPRITDVFAIVVRYLRERDAEAFVRKKLLGYDPSHGWMHTERVLENATELALECGADVEVVRLAAIFHEVERPRGVEQHAERGAEVARSFLGNRLESDRVEKVVRAIASHHKKAEELAEVEEMVLWDADKLDALGPIGLARCLLEAGWLGQGIEEALKHYQADVEEFEQKMHFDVSRKIARKRVEEGKVMASLLKKWLRKLTPNHFSNAKESLREF